VSRDYVAAALADIENANGEEAGPWTQFMLDRAQAHATLALVEVVRQLCEAITTPPAEETRAAGIPDGMFHARPASGAVALRQCGCEELSPSGNGVCVGCGHLADFHEAHNGPCTLEVEG